PRMANGIASPTAAPPAPVVAPPMPMPEPEPIAAEMVPVDPEPTPAVIPPQEPAAEPAMAMTAVAGSGSQSNGPVTPEPLFNGLDVPGMLRGDRRIIQ